MVETYTLPNGIPVIVCENHAAKVVAIQAWVHRGSAHEPESLAGISHFIEHALFKGTKKRRVGEIASDIESRGGEINAYTSFEETVYYTTLASRFFDEGLDVIADAVLQPLFETEEMIKEREVILEEIRRSEDSPSKILFTNLWKTAFKNTPYGRPVLGFHQTVSKLGAKQLLHYFKNNYHAGTISLVVVGDIKAQEVLTKIRKYFGKLKPAKDEFNVKALPLKNSPASIITASRDIQECHVSIGIPGPHLLSPTTPALDLACSALGQGESSWLYQTMVKEKRLATEAEMGFVATDRCGLVTLNFLTSPDKLEKCVLESRLILEHAATKGISNEDIERIKTSFEADISYGKETVDRYARRLGYYHLHFRDPFFEKKYMDQLMGLSTTQVQESLGTIAQRQPCLSLMHPKEFEVDKKTLLRALYRPLPKIVYSKPKPDVLLTREGSVRFLSKPVHHLPTLSVRFIFPGGSREEEESELGIGNLMAHLWTSGTKNQTSKQISHELESCGAAVSAFCGKNTSGLVLEMLSKHWKRLRPLVEDIFSCPEFPEEEFITAQSITLKEIRSEKDSPGALNFRHFLELLYGSHAYGKSGLGTEKTVSALTPKKIKEFYKKFIHRNHLVVSSVGELDPGSWNEEMKSLLLKIPETGRQPKPPLPLSAHQTPQIKTAVKSPLSQSHLILGFLGATHLDKDASALKLLASCLTGQGGRLFLELRDKRSLAYTVSALQTEGPEPGYFAFYIACAPDKVETSLKGIRTEIDKLLTIDISKSELERSKRYWIGRFELDLQRYGAQAMLYGLDEVYGLGYDYSEQLPDIIRKLNAKDLKMAAEKYFRMDAPIISLVHPTPFELERLLQAWNGITPLRPRKTQKTVGLDL